MQKFESASLEQCKVIILKKTRLELALPRCRRIVVALVRSLTCATPCFGQSRGAKMLHRSIFPCSPYHPAPCGAECYRFAGSRLSLRIEKAEQTDVCSAFSGLSDKTWTCGLYHPKVARYQLRHTQKPIFLCHLLTTWLLYHTYRSLSILITKILHVLM